MNRADDAPTRRHVQIVASGGSTAERQMRFAVSVRDGGEHAAIVHQSSWALSINPQDSAVLMDVASDSAQACRWIWRRQLDSFIAEAEPGCELAALGIPGALRLGAEELWVDADAAVVPNKLYRAHSYDCFVALRLRNGEPQALTGLTTHDRGGTIDLESADTPPRQLQLLLRRGLWPSNSGNNFVQLISIYLYERGNANPLGNGWATPESGRVGFGIGDELPGGQNLSARCTRQSSTG